MRVLIQFASMPYDLSSLLTKKDMRQQQDIAEPLYRSPLLYKASNCEGECILLEITPIRLITWKYVLYLVASICTVGLFALLVYWYPRLKKVLYFEECELEPCTHFFIQNYDGQFSFARRNDDEYYSTPHELPRSSIFFTNRYMKYMVFESEKVVRAVEFDHSKTLSHMLAPENLPVSGLTSREVEQLLKCYGPGTMVIDRPSILVLFAREVFRPLYLFILFSMVLWSFTQYYYYASVIFFTSSVSIAINLYQVKKLNDKIFNMAYYEIPLNVLRNGEVLRISSVEVVPGDVVFLKDPIKLSFEGVILEGSALINECALTGESVPVIKKADLIEHYRDQHSEINKSAVIYEGTTVMQINNKQRMRCFERYREELGIPVCVTKTNFSTTKGQLIRVISFPKDRENQFEKESRKFLLFLFGLAVASYIFLITQLYDIVEHGELAIKFLDLITITVPPGLPVSMTFGIIYAIEKLKAKDIFCISPNKIISGGRVNLACFDKTGTLTEDFMDFYGLVPCFMSRFYPFIENVPADQVTTKQSISSIIKRNPLINQALTNMAVNHSITEIEATRQLVGDPMEVKLFEFGEFQMSLSEHHQEALFSFSSKRGHKGNVYRRFQFDSEVQRMSVVASSSEEQGREFVYCKGSPEVMKSIMIQKSIPENYESVLREYASHGFRVLAIASRRVDLSKIAASTQRQEIEKDLVFDGFEVFENKIKRETSPAIQGLKEASIKCVMITGDNALTGSNIAFKSQIADLHKKMVICDYDSFQGSFHLENFDFSESHNSEEQKLNALQNDSRTFGGLNHTHLKEEIQMQQIPKSLSNKDRSAAYIEKDYGPLDTDTNKFMDTLLKVIKQADGKVQLCLTGKVFNRLYPSKALRDSESEKIQNDSQADSKAEKIKCELREELFGHVTVFARAKPNDKAQIVMTFQDALKEKNTVLMCGDGVNDCGALKQADVGLSLSQAEASISAPFTSKTINISSSVELIKECRAGLATNFSLFNIMALYSLIQYTTVIITQLYYSYPSDFQFLYWDLAGNFFFFLTFGYTATVSVLSADIPNKSLFSLTNTIQIIAAFLLQILGQVSMIWTLQGTLGEDIDYFSNGGKTMNARLYRQRDELIKDSPEDSILFLFTNYMYVSTLLAFSISKPWRKEFYTNIPFMVVLILNLIYSTLLVLVPGARPQIFKIRHMDSAVLNWFVLGMAIFFSAVIYCLQKLSLEPLGIWLKQKYPSNKYI